MFDCNINEEIELATDHWREQMPANIAALIDQANSDLYSGPLYLDADGEECSCFDEGAKAFDFKAAVKTIGEWCEQIDDLSVSCFQYDDETDEETEYSENIEDSGRAIIRALLGCELSHYV